MCKKFDKPVTEAETVKSSFKLAGLGQTECKRIKQFDINPTATTATKTKHQHDLSPGSFSQKKKKRRRRRKERMKEK